MSKGNLRSIGWTSLALGFAAAGCGSEVSSTETEGAGVEQLAWARAPSREVQAGARLFVKPPNPGAVKQALDLVRQRRLADAARIAAMAAMPQAVWFTGGTPEEVKASVRRTMAAAAATRSVPVLAAYNIPFRDCAQYSAGGAKDTAEYQDWIDAFAAGIGNGKAIVILEPDALGIIPYNTTLFGSEDWCKPTVTGENGDSVPAPGANPEERYAQLHYAIDRILERAPGASIYLDGTHSAWLGVSEAAYRLYKAGFRDGVQRVQGFYLNGWNFQPTSEVEQFGTWVSMCLAAGTPGVGPDWMQNPDTGVPHFDWCPGQYDPATGYTTVNFTPEFAAGVTAGLEGLMDGASPQVKFVIDTSRNGKGAWRPPENASYPDPQDWCNPPGRGAGVRPRVLGGEGLLLAHLWIKIPGESDGSCNRGIAGSTTDPEWGAIVDPPASAWFPEQALELARLATPPLF
ncbi:MAG TPA: glycoside hydrolase family 6 protein [Polyangiaceae bacterium]